MELPANENYDTNLGLKQIIICIHKKSPSYQWTMIQIQQKIN